MGMTLRSVEKAARYQTLFCFFAVALILFALIRVREYIIINTPSMAIIVLQKERERWELCWDRYLLLVVDFYTAV